MGEYADDAMWRDYDLEYHSEELHYYDEEPEVGDGSPRQRYKRRNHQIKYDTYEYKRIIHETAKAWLLEMSGGAKRWLPKSKCHVSNDVVYVPSWLVAKILFGDAVKSKDSNIKNKQLDLEGI